MLTPWTGYQELIVTHKVKESDSVVSFYLSHESGQQLPTHQAGQFISIKLALPGQENIRPRQYTLSMEPGKPYYRISVKKEEKGLISPYLHDHITIGDKLLSTIPMGKFTLDKGETPLILIGAGIGITPIASMLYEAVKTKRQITLVQCMENSKHHPLLQELQEVVKHSPLIQQYIFYTKPLIEDILSESFTHQGRLDQSFIKNNLHLTGDYYFCGPQSFIESLCHSLLNLQVTEDHIHYESFGSND